MKTVSLLLLIAIGYFFRKKIGSKESKDGIRTMILSLALPATIFIALLKIDFVPGLVIVPIMALGFNLIVFAMLSKLPVQSLFNLPANQYRTLILLIPSLAPGLSSFPFILEYSGESSLAVAALADLGNKVFVLVIAYLIAMKWYFAERTHLDGGRSVRLKALWVSLVNEPVNLVIITAVVMLSLGLGYDAFPEFIRSSVDKISLMMTPLVLLFIGISIKFSWQQFKAIFSFVFFRSAIAFLISGLILLFFPVSDLATALLIVVFPQSACSFWPYAHMAVVNEMESKDKEHRASTFDLDFAMNVLACSLPFSVLIIMLIYSSGSFFAKPSHLFEGVAVLLILAAVPVLIPARKAISKTASV
ncbi:MAG TPA: permease [Cyclobacteriaceae bacterium]|nr:permease [Cyclobacteriaceae bacterium]